MEDPEADRLMENGETSLARTADERQASQGTSWYVAVFLVVNAALGSAFLNFPRAFDEAGGVASALGMQSGLLVIASGTLIILAFCSDACKSATYQDVVLATVGRKVGTFCSFVIFVYCFGTCITFLVIIGDQWDRFFYSFTGDQYFCHKFYMDRRFTIVVSSIFFILPFCYPKRIDFLKYASAAGVLANVYLDFLQVYLYYTGDYANQTGEIKTSPRSWTDPFLVAPTIFFGYQCHVSAVPIYSCLRKRTIGEFLKTVLTAMLVCAVTYSVAATYGYWTFGSNVDPDVLSNYNAKDPLVLAALIAMAFKTYTTYPLIIFCGRTAFDSLWTSSWRLSEDEAQAGERRRRVTQVSIWFPVTLLVAAFVPGIEFVIPVLGGFAAFFVVIFPALCLLELSLKMGDQLGSSKDKESESASVDSTPSPSPSPPNHAIQNENDTTAVFVRETRQRQKLKQKALLATALFLTVFGAFMFGIIGTNSVLDIDYKQPLCQ